MASSRLRRKTCPAGVTTNDERSPGRTRGPSLEASVRRLGLLVWLLPILGSTAISQTWFRRGKFIARGDIDPFIRDGLAHEYGWLWNHQLISGGSTNAQVARAPEVLVSQAVQLLGGSDVLAQRVFLGLVMAFMAAGVICISSAVASSRTAVAAGAVVGIFNPFLLSQIPNPTAPTAIGVVGIIGGLGIRSLRGQPVSALTLAIATLPASYLANNPPTLAVAFISTAAIFLLAGIGSSTARQTRLLCARAFPIGLLLNLWWIAPMMVTTIGGAEGALFSAQTDVAAWSWTHARSSVANILTLNTSWAWAHSEYVPYARRLDGMGWTWMRFAVPCLALSAPLVTTGRRRWASVRLLGVALAVVFLAKGLHPPLADVNLWLYHHVPGLWLLREPMTKLGVLLVLLYVGLVTLAVDGLCAANRTNSNAERRLQFMACGLTLASAIAYVHPLWNGEAIPGRSAALSSAHVSVPVGWRSAASFLNARMPSAGRVLVLPVNDFYQMPTSWGYYGVDALPHMLFRRPVVQLFPGAYYQESPAYRGLVLAVQDSIVESDEEASRRLLKALGVSHVVLRHDLDMTYPGRSFVAPSKVEAGLEAAGGLRRLTGNSVVSIFAVDGGSGIRASVYQGRVVSSRGGTEAVRTAALDEAVVDGITEGLWLSSVNGKSARETTVRDNVLSPSHHDITVLGAPKTLLLAFAESYAPGWRLEGLPTGTGARHVVVDTYANGWLIENAPPTLKVSAVYIPATQVRRALLISQLTGLVVTLVHLRRWVGLLFRRVRARVNQKSMKTIPAAS